jgi:hypothetical protein
MARRFKAQRPIEPLEQTIGQDVPRVLASQGPAKEALEPQLIQPVERPMASLDSEKVQMMAFMNEDIEVHIHSTTDKEAEQVFELFINGERQLFRRNEKKVVKRKFVDLLARLKPTTYTHRELTRSDGVRDIQYNMHTGLRYPFSVIRDPHPRGNDWLRSVLAEA